LGNWALVAQIAVGGGAIAAILAGIGY